MAGESHRFLISELKQKPSLCCIVELSLTQRVDFGVASYNIKTPIQSQLLSEAGGEIYDKVATVHCLIMSGVHHSIHSPAYLGVSKSILLISTIKLWSPSRSSAEQARELDLELGIVGASPKESYIGLKNRPVAHACQHLLSSHRETRYYRKYHK